MKIKYLFLFTIYFCISFIIVDISYAQSIPKDLSNVQVSNLSDAQISQLMQQAGSSGLSDEQLVQMAEQRGLPSSEGAALHSRIDIIRKRNNNNSISDTTTTTGRTLNYNSENNTPSKNPDVFNSASPKIFGADIFNNSNLTFAPNLNLATPVNYIVGPQDQLNINIYGNSLVNWKLEVSPDGNINIPGIGLLNVAGKTIDQATQAIKSRLAANNYAIGHGTTIQVSLGNIRSIKVILIGEVKKPGSYTLPSLATAFNALYAAGGPNSNGSFRQIEIIRNNKIIRHLDIYDFLVKGDQKNNIGLQDQDIIRVPTYRTRVDLTGEVKTPALFEVLPGETLKDVINFAGGFTDMAYTDRIKVIQISDQQLKITDVVESDYGNYIPIRGDKYIVDRILDRFENRVTIQGAVFRPGEFELEKGLTLSALIKKAGGIKEDAFTGRGSITRLKPDNTTQQLSFNVTNILNNSAADIPLQREDVISISSIFDLRDQYRVSIKGEVRRPGEFSYADSMTVADLILKAGGFTEGASAKRIEVSRRTFTSDPMSKNSTVAQVYSVDINADLKTGEANFTLQPFDIVSIYSLPGYEKQKTVKVEGEVVYPGYYTIEKKNEKISDIVARAGGLTASADPDGSSLRRSNTAVLGIDRSQSDSATLINENNERLSRLKRASRDSSNTDSLTMRNNYIGINLKEILAKPGVTGDLILENGDVLRIPKEQQIVRINGDVLYPSAVVYENGKSFKDYVLNAGGYAPDALKRGAYIVYPNGTVKGTSKFLFFNSHPEVKPGSEIFVPRKPVPKSNATQTILSLTTALASLGVIILGIISLHK